MCNKTITDKYTIITFFTITYHFSLPLSTIINLFVITLYPNYIRMEKNNSNNSIIKVESIDQFNRYFHQPTYHPLVSVADLSHADLSLFDPTDFGMYCVVLMDVDFGELVLRNSCMRYRAGTVFTMKPGDIVSMNLDSAVHPRGWMLAFRPELIVNTGLGRDFYMFNFFDYEVFEALVLQESEHRVMLNCFANINAELHAPNDELTSHMLRLGIGHMLSHCRRYYDRQFDTRKLKNSDLVMKLNTLIDGYLANEEMTHRYGQPTVTWCSNQFHLSANYFGDMVKRELHMTAQEYIQNKIVEKAKALIADPHNSINEVAEMLGFAYSNHFTRFFRKKTGMSPTEFRRNINNSL